MKHLLAAIFAAALVCIPVVGLARTTYATPYLSCASTYPVVSVGNAGRFNVVTNVNGPFMWVADDEDYGVYNAGSQFITPFTHTGRQQVTVVWGSTRASCFVDVVPAPGYGEPYAAPVFNNQAYGPNVTLSSVAYPLLPNTGFEPQTLATFAFALVFLLGTSIALYPHAKKAFTIVTR
jgi:hypothetical protein